MTQLTTGGHSVFGSLAVHNGRILYAAVGEPLQNNASQCCWSVSTAGGESRRERMPFLNPEEYVAWLCPLDSWPGVILIRSQVPAPTQIRGELWLADFDGSKPRRIHVESDSYSVSPI